MKTGFILREGFRTYSENLTVFLIAALAVLLGSATIIFAPPLLFGLYAMAFKAVSGEQPMLSQLKLDLGLCVKSWFLAFLFFIGVLIPTSVAYTLVGWAGLSNVASILAVAAAFLGFTCTMILTLTYTVPIIVGDGVEVTEGVKKGIELVLNNPVETLLLVASLTLTTVMVGWLPVVGPLVTIPYTAIAHSTAVKHLR